MADRETLLNRIRPVMFWEVGLPATLAVCGRCGSVITDDVEHANRREHEEWHEAIEAAPSSSDAPNQTATEGCGALEAETGIECDRHPLPGVHEGRWLDEEHSPNWVVVRWPTEDGPASPPRWTDAEQPASVVDSQLRDRLPAELASARNAALHEALQEDAEVDALEDQAGGRQP